MSDVSDIKAELLVLKKENAELRKLLHRMLVCQSRRSCNGCEFADDACDFEYDMRELGVEV